MIIVLLLSLVGAVIAAGVGTFWYSNATPMGRIHMQYLGLDKLTEEEKKVKMEEAKPKMVKKYIGQLVLSFFTAFFVVFVIAESMFNGVPLLIALMFPLFSWFCFVVPTIGSAILWGNVDSKIAWKMFFSDIFSNLVIILLIALMTSFFV
jgi:hypothetical protein